MKVFLPVAFVCLGPLAQAQLEGTARMPINTAIDVHAARFIPSCAPGVPVTVSGTRLICSPVPNCVANEALVGRDGRMVCQPLPAPPAPSLDIQMGYAPGPSGYVAFPRPFARPPRVFMFIHTQTSHGPCRGFNNHHSTPWPHGVTTKGFSFTGFSSSDGCNYHHLNSVNWLAIAP